MSHKAMSIADSARVKMPPGPQESPVPALQLGDDFLDAQRVFADGQGGEFLDRDAQAAGHLAAVEGQADALDAVIGAQAQDDDWAGAPGFLRHVGQGVVFRNA